MTISKTPASQPPPHGDPAAHEALLAEMTGGMVQPVKAFEGSERLREDGRPRPDFRQELRTIANVRNAGAVLWVLALPFLTAAGAVLAYNRINAASWATTPLVRWIAVAAMLVVAISIVGGAQLRMFVLHHEAAHRLLFSSRLFNDLVGINILGWIPFGAGRHAYRRIHTRHHRDEFGPDEPDFLLYSFYPIERGSMFRKLLRDATGVSAWRIVKPLVTGIAKPGRRITSLRFYLVQLLIFVAFAFTGHPWLYLVLWVFPFAVVYQILNRLRAIAEHGGMTRSPDRRMTTHHVEQFWLTQRWLAPYQVGHHLAHHVDSGVPFRNLPKLTKALTEDGYITNEITWTSYRALWQAQSHGAQPQGAQPQETQAQDSHTR